jgi:hypothetical protein
MEVIENTPEVAVDDVLDRPLFAFLAQTPPDGLRVSPLGFLWKDGVVWHIARTGGRSYPERVRRDSRTALAVVDFDPAAGRVEHVGIRVEASLEPYDPDRAGRLLAKYLGPDRRQWPDRFSGLDADGYRLVRVDPATAVARDQSYPVPEADR